MMIYLNGMTDNKLDPWLRMQFNRKSKVLSEEVLKPLSKWLPRKVVAITSPFTLETVDTDSVMSNPAATGKITQVQIGTHEVCKILTA